MSDNDEFLPEVEEVSDNQLNTVAKLGIQYIGLENEIKKMENMLELRKKQFKTLSEVAIPEAMSAIGMKSFSLANGFCLTVKPVFLVTLPKDKVDLADEWLNENGHSGMMKHSLEVPLTRGLEQDQINTLKEQITKQGYVVLETKGIHYQTLAKWGREMQDEGEPIPEEIFNVYRSNKTDISFDG